MITKNLWGTVGSYQWSKARANFLSNCKETNCYYCNVLITEDNKTVDHKIPISKGGDEFNPENMVLCCFICNNSKKDYDYEYFLANRERLIKEYMIKYQARNRTIDTFFNPEPFKPTEVEVIKKFRSNKTSLIRISAKSIEFNFAEWLPENQEDAIKWAVIKTVKKLGNPNKKLQMYINFSGTEIMFEISKKNQILLDIETLEERKISNKEAAVFRGCSNIKSVVE